MKASLLLFCINTPGTTIGSDSLNQHFNIQAQKFAKALGITITWGSWAVAVLLPGLVCFQSQ